MVDRFRSDAAQRRALDAFAADPSGPNAAEPDRELLEAICACLTELVATLKPEYADALRRVDLGDDSLETYAAGAAITRGNAAVRLFRARQALRRRVQQSCGTCATHGCYQCECQGEHHPHPAGGVAEDDTQLARR
jgi:RNA polymerase sigma-70 factor (ECF subfamily)